MSGLFEAADEIADMVISAFSKLHPNIRMNHAEWSDLHEMIDREVRGHFGDQNVTAHDLLKDLP